MGALEILFIIIMKHYFIKDYYAPCWYPSLISLTVSVEVKHHVYFTLLMAWQRAKSPLDDVTSTVPRNLMVNFQCSSSPSVHVNVIWNGDCSSWGEIPPTLAGIQLQFIQHFFLLLFFFLSFFFLLFFFDDDKNEDEDVELARSESASSKYHPSLGPQNQ